MEEENKSIGQILRRGREGKGATSSEVAAVTRIKVQIVDAMELDDFSGIAAPAYAKGFIRMYAQYLEIDPVPLVEEYLAKHVHEARPLLTKETPAQIRGRKAEEAAEKLDAFFKQIPRERWIQAGAVVAGLLLVVVVVMALGSSMRSCEKAEDKAPVKVPAESMRKVLQEPPEPYL